MKKKSFVPRTLNRFLFHSLGILLLMNFIFSDATAQTQNRAWQLGQDIIEFQNLSGAPSVTTDPIIVPGFYSNSIQDPTGAMLFGITDAGGGGPGHIYVRNGNNLLPETFNNPDGSAFSSKYHIVPVPGECKKFYIIGLTRYGVPQAKGLRPIYITLDLTDENNPIVSNGGNGTLFDLYSQAILVDWPYFINPHPGYLDRLHLAVTQLVGNPAKRFLFMTTGACLIVSEITQSGISDAHLHGCFPNVYSHEVAMSGELEIHQIDPTRILVASVYEEINMNAHDGWGIYTIELNYNTILGEYEYTTGMLTNFFVTPPATLDNPISGVEFSPDGHYLYITQNQSPYIRCLEVDLTLGTLTELTTWNNYTSAADLQSSNIELGYNGELYFVDQINQRLISFNSPNNPTAGSWNSLPLTSPSPVPNGTLGSQIDGEVYWQNVAQISHECCDLVTIWDQEDFVAQTGSHTWTASSNPLNNNSGLDAWIHGTLTIPNGSDITITAMDVHFGLNGKLLINPGGKLTIKGTMLRGNGMCENMWKGVEVQGNPSSTLTADQGQFYMVNDGTNPSTIEYALIGVAAQSIPDPMVHAYSHQGGHFELNDGRFYNNKRSVYAIERGATIPNFYSQINRCEFRGLAPYLWYPYAGQQPEFFIQIYRYTGSEIQIGYTAATQFNNSFSDGGYGIWQSETFNVDITGCDFASLKYGIYAVTSSMIANSDLHISSCTFNNTFNSINLNGLKGFYIDGNAFNTWNQGQNSNYYGVFLRGGVGDFLIDDNNFNRLKRGITIWDDSPIGGEIFDNDFTACFRGIDLGDRQTALRIKCNRFVNDMALTFPDMYSVAIGDWGCLADQLPSMGAGNEFYNLPNRFDIIAVSPSSVSPPCNAGQFNFVYNAYTNPNHTPFVGTNSAVDVQQAGTMPVSFCLTPRESVMELAGGSTDAAQSLIAQETDAVTQQLWVNDLVGWYVDNSALDDAVGYLQARNDEAAQRMLLPLYVELSQFSNAQALIEPYNNGEVEGEGFNYYLLNNTVLDWAESGRNMHEMTDDEKAILENVAVSETNSSSQAKAILHFVFDEEFDDGDFNDSIPPRLENYGSVGEEHFFNMQPNPASDMCEVNYVIPDENNSADMNLYDVTGRLIHTWNLSKGGGRLLIDTKQYGNGMYMLEFHSDNYMDRQKLMIQKNR